jgi:hypothetical protein
MIGILGDEDDDEHEDDSSNSEFRLNQPSPPLSCSVAFQAKNSKIGELRVLI